MSFLIKIKFQRYTVLLITAGILLLSAQKPPAREYQLKAAFIFNFTQFTEWPASTYNSARAPFVIGILGEDPFGTYLDELVKEETVNGHSILVQRFSSAEEIKNCHILFVKMPKPANYPSILASLKGKNILTVGEDPNFIKDGGMIRFMMLNNKIQFQINPEAAREENIIISSKLLRLAEIVTLKKSN